MNCLRRPNRPMPTGAKNEEGRPQGQPSSDPFDEVDGVRPRRVFPDEVFSFEELNESATSARWTASRRRKTEV